MTAQPLKNKIILGTVQFGLNYGIHNQVGKLNKEEVHQILDFAKSSEIEMLDTADAYGDSQNQIGEYQKKTSLFFKILTKYKGIRSDKIIEHTHSILQILGATQLECVSLHDFKELSEIKSYSHIKEAGLTKKIGVSVYNPDECIIAMKNPAIDIVQIPFNILDNENRWNDVFELKSKLQKKIEIHSRSCFLQGLFHKTFEQINNDTPYLADLVPDLKIALTAAQGSQKTLAEYSLLYCLQNKNIDKVLIGVDSLSQLKQNLKVLEAQVAQNAFHAINQIKIRDVNLINPSNWPLLKEKYL